MKAIIPFFIYLLINAEVSIITKTKYGKLVPITLISSVLLFYLVGFVDMHIGVYMCYLFIICFGIYIFKQKQIKQLLTEYVLTPGLAAFVLLFLFTAVLNRGRAFSVIDDWGHLGMRAKEIFRLGTFYSVPESLAMAHKAYPPFFSIVESSYCMLANNFSEGMCLQSLQLFSLSLFLPLFEKNKKCFRFILLLVSVILFGNVVAYTGELTYPSLFYNCTYVEWPMAIYIAYMFYLIIKLDFSLTKDYVYTCIAMCGFILTKQISIIFILLGLTMLAIKLMLNKKMNLKLIICFALPLLTLLSWNTYISFMNVPPDFNTGSFDYFAIIKYLAGTLTEYQNTIISSFIYAFFLRPLIEGPINIPYFWLLLVLFIIILSLGYLTTSREKKS